MYDILERLTKQAADLDDKGLKSNAKELDSIILALAFGMGQGGGLKSPEEAARIRVQLLGGHPNLSDEELYEKYLAEEKAKFNVKYDGDNKESNNVEPPSAAKTRPVTNFIIQQNKAELMTLIKKDPAQEQAIRAKLVPLLNKQTGGLDVYSKKNIRDVLNAAEILKLIPEQTWLKSLYQDSF